MTFDGDPIWDHDQDCRPDALCAACEAEWQARMAEQDAEDLARARTGREAA